MAAAQYIVDCLAGRETDPADEKALAGLTEPSCLEQLLLLAHGHGLLQLLIAHLTARGVVLPEHWRAVLREEWVNSLALTSQLEAILGQFARDKINCIPLKGPILAEELYGDVTLRPSCDIDLLLMPAHLNDAEATLLQEGFVVTGCPDTYHRQYEREGTYVELHFALVPPPFLRLDPRGLWLRAQRTRFHNVPIRQLSREDSLLYLSLHAFKHGYSKFIWVVDLARILDSLENCPLPAVVEHARAEGLESVLLLSCELAHQILGAPLTPEMKAALEHRPDLAREAAGIASTLLDGPPKTGISVESWGLSVALQDGLLRRWRYRLRYLAPTREDHRWAEERGIPSMLLHVLRPFRLVGKYGFAQAVRIVFPSSLRTFGRKEILREEDENGQHHSASGGKSETSSALSR